MNHGWSWSAENDQVDTNPIRDDDGARFEQHSHHPKHATYFTSWGQPSARLQVERVYATIAAVRVPSGTPPGPGITLGTDLQPQIPRSGHGVVQQNVRTAKHLLTLTAGH